KTFAADINVKNNRNIGYRIISNEGKVVYIEESFLNPVESDLLPKGLEKTQTKVNYFVGKKENHHSGISTYNSVDLGEIWSGINIKLSSGNKNIEKIFELKPDADANEIRIEIKGAKDICENSDKELQVDLPSGEDICFTQPKAWQEINGEITYVPVKYKVYADNSVLSYGFELGEYNPGLPVYIDPLLASSFLGGSLFDYAQNVIIGKDNDVFVGGNTSSHDFPTTNSSYDESLNDSTDVFIARLNKDLTVLKTCTFIGGNNFEFLKDMILDKNDNVYFTGLTFSSNYPTTLNAYDNSYNSEGSQWFGDMMISMLNSSLDDLTYSTFVGSYHNDYGSGIDIDTSGNIFVAGISTSGIPPVGPQFENRTNGFVFLKMDNTLSNLLSTNSIKGNSYIWPWDLVIDSSNQVFITGYTSATDFPTTVDCFQKTNNGKSDAFLIRLENDLSSLLASTYIGGKEDDISYCVIIDSTNNAYIAGETNSDNFPYSLFAYDTSYANSNFKLSDAFISILDSNLMEMKASTYLGGQNFETAYDLVLDSLGNIFVSGYTFSYDFPVFCNSYDNSFNGDDDCFISKFNMDLSDLLASTYIGGNKSDHAYSIDINSFGNIFSAGYTESNNFPALLSFDTTYNGGDSDGFVFKISPNLESPYPCCTDLINPIPNSTNNPTTLMLSWSEAIGATGYYLSVGSSLGEYNILDDIDIGNKTEYQLSDLPCGDSIFVNIKPYNDYGVNNHCYSFLFLIAEPFLQIDSYDICEGDSILWNGEIYSDPGTYNINFIDINGCDSTFQLVLNVNPSNFESKTLGICEGDSVRWYNHYYTEEGNYYQNFTNIYGCDSIYEMVLEVYPNSEIHEFNSICPGDTLNWEGQQLYSEGIYTAEYFSINDCDSTIVLDLKISSEYFMFDTVTICNGDSYQWQNQNYSLAGDYTAIYQTEEGCDSIFYLNLNLNDSYNFHDELSICEGDSIEWQGENYSVSGEYYKSFQSVDGCDSFYKLTLNVNENYYFEEEFSICQDESIEWHGKTLSEAGVYYKNYQTIYECDSNYQLTLTKVIIDTSVYISGDSLVAVNDENAIYQWFTCPDYKIIEGATQPTYLATKSGSYAVEITQEGCVDTSSCYYLIHSGFGKIEDNIDFTIFPNPVFHDQITIFHEKNNRSYSIYFMDLKGHNVLKKENSFGITKIDSGKLKSGVYLLIIKSENYMVFKKIVVIE
ncbi:MAG TPA: T9SS type A sorting domain-containing protein, partial [Bacteroidetes bacterium]|nr:T9SS type A sorting domain-containing protein [Bacteroidota bacterium]